MDTIENIKDFTHVFLVATMTVMPPTGRADTSITTQDIESWSEYVFLGDIIQVIFFITALLFMKLICTSCYSLTMLITMLSLTSISVGP